MNRARQRVLDHLSLANAISYVSALRAIERSVLVRLNLNFLASSATKLIPCATLLDAEGIKPIQPRRLTVP